jgi:hypothetical protein
VATGAWSASVRAPGALKQGANLCDVVLLTIGLTIGDSLTTGAQRIDICRGDASHLSLDSRARNPHYRRGHLFLLHQLLRPAAMKRFFHDSADGALGASIRYATTQPLSSVATGRPAAGYASRATPGRGANFTSSLFACPTIPAGMIPTS